MLGTPVAVVILFAMVSLVISEVFRLRSFDEVSELKRYTRREMLMVFGRSFLVVATGLLLAIIFSYQTEHTAEEKGVNYAFYLLDAFLTLYALGNIVKGEKLREVNLRRVQSENALLKTQLNPHFLYNTLNNIDALIWIAPDKASEALLRLSFLMRYMTYKAERRFVSVGEEVNYISEFIELQKMRFDNRNLVDFKVEIADQSLLIAPMLLIPIVENSFKHATDKHSDGAIRIEFKADHNGFVLSTINEFDPSKNLSKDKEGGVGLNLIRQRLKLLYPSRHELKTEKKDKRYQVYLKVWNTPI